MGPSDSVPVDEKMGDPAALIHGGTDGQRFRYQLIVLAVAAVVFLGCIISPPSLMDDVDAVQAQIARNMLDSGDWVTAHLDGIAYLEKSPLKYWMIADLVPDFRRPRLGGSSAGGALGSAAVLADVPHRRLGFLLACGALCGARNRHLRRLFLFTRIQIPDVTIAVTIALAMWAFLRTLDPEEQRPAVWSMVMAAAIGTGLAAQRSDRGVFPIAAALLYLAFTGQIRSRAGVETAGAVFVAP